MKLLVTGAAGFIGSNFVTKIVKDFGSDIELLIYDKLTYAGRLDNLDEIKNKYTFVKADICDRKAFVKAVKDFNPEVIIAFAAESHVDRSIDSPQVFLETNILGTEVILSTVRDYKIPKLVHISTDEVYGSLSEGEANESCAFDPNSPYSVSKASGDMLCLAYFTTYGVPVSVIRGSNCYGPRQHPEKLIPKSITNLESGKTIGIYGDGKNVREWTFTEDFCDGVWAVVEKGVVGEAYNLGSGALNRVSNNVIASALCDILSKDKNDSIEYIADRLGHDQRYALNSKKLRGLGWEPKYNLTRGLAKTAEWYLKNRSWWSGK